MSCLTAADFERYHSGLLSPAERRDIESHLAGCDACRSGYEVYQGNEAFLAVARPAMGDSADFSATLTDTANGPDIQTSYPEIHGYKIVGVAGRGGMGIVYEAVQEALNRKVALKVLPAILATGSPDAVTRFRREAAAAAKLHHTNIIPIYDSGQSRDGYYYAMELIDGEPLDRVIKKLAIADVTDASASHIAESLLTRASRVEGQSETNETETRTLGSDDSDARKGASDEPSSSSMRRGRVYFQLVARWMADVANALDFAHKQGVIHRDIKPSNLILSRDGRLMVADFGLARASEDKSVTMTGSLLGTLRYMSPEQALAKRMPIDHRTDVYSLGVTMYELLTFQPAFSGRDDKEIISQLVTRDPTAPRKLNPSVPRELDTICRKCVEKSPAARYETAADLAADLERYINDLPIVAKPLGPVGRVFKFSRRHRAAVAAAGLALLLTVTLTMLAMYSRQLAMDRVDKLNDEATRETDHHHWDVADELYGEILKFDATNVRALANWARSKVMNFNSLPEHSDTRLLEEAHALCQQALEIDPDYVAGLNVYGVVLKKLGRYDEAIEVYTRVIGLEPKGYAARANLAIIHALKGDLAEAEASLQTAAKLASTDDQYAVDVWRNLASLQHYLGKLDAAQHNIEKARQCDRENIATWLIRARLLLNGDPSEASESAGYADVRAEHRNPKVKRIRALAQLRGGYFDEARSNARAAIELGDMVTINQLIMSIAQAKLGHLDRSRAHLAQAGAHWPGELKDEGDFLATADRGNLWFETGSELIGLQAEAKRALAELSP